MMTLTKPSRPIHGADVLGIGHGAFLGEASIIEEAGNFGRTPALNVSKSVVNE